MVLSRRWNQARNDICWGEDRDGIVQEVPLVEGKDVRNRMPLHGCHQSCIVRRTGCLATIWAPCLLASDLAPRSKTDLSPLSTAWQRMATGKETKEGPNRCYAPGAARTCLRRLRQWSTASPVAAPPRDLRAYDHRLRFTCCPPPATWGFRTGNSGQGQQVPGTGQIGQIGQIGRRGAGEFRGFVGHRPMASLYHVLIGFFDTPAWYWRLHRATKLVVRASVRCESSPFGRYPGGLGSFDRPCAIDGCLHPCFARPTFAQCFGPRVDHSATGGHPIACGVSSRGPGGSAGRRRVARAPSNGGESAR